MDASFVIWLLSLFGIGCLIAWSAGMSWSSSKTIWQRFRVLFFTIMSALAFVLCALSTLVSISGYLQGVREKFFPFLIGNGPADDMVILTAVLLCSGVLPTAAIIWIAARRVRAQTE